ncbi:trypsin-like peptidase domain-containing protein [Priestia aryabhattai]|uniref:S1C family serine protease n=1 Tax=Priestia TaxID=2800373 RepID=UPI00039AA8A5|nr:MULTISPECIES: trypsin-like peptidase domain-containing protein [Priestia]MCM2978240.1 trypsin-like peptidase domain-containing protein [Priestia aryabhattai]MEB4871407.1 trypsin-like peptidase domain-containing protein [Priestia megaterium]MED3886000.1 trypsin-like peptidase domain-containing protein [Priestia aryabhattai]MED3958193.1 trypsin-like peptidase domain-containing protein [Priestia aryabhattai]MED4259210.1 trypsin-like peptidase domain-containing protein [Priestia aryabhattai]
MINEGSGDSVEHYDEGQEPNSRPPKRRRGYFASALIGAIIGALIVLLLMPALVRNGILPYGWMNDENGDEQTGSTIQKSVSLDVTTAVTKAVSEANAAVVGVVNIQNSESFWNDERTDAGTGSGVIYKKQGNKAYIVTNYHVIKGANEIEVSFSNGTRVSAKILGSDDLMDLAVLEIDAGHVTKVATFGNSDKLKAGEPVIAIGNPLGLQFSGSVTQGVVSGVNRVIPQDLNGDGNPDWQSEVIQTDAAINPGNSGGALVNIDGELIGINSMKIAQEAVEGIGLAIPINMARPIINDLERYGEVRRPYLGVSTLSLSEVSGYHLKETLKLPHDVVNGVAVLKVEPGSPAAKAGLKEYDVIVELDHSKVRDIATLRKHLYIEKEIGDKMNVTFYRDGKKKSTEVKLTRQMK